MNTLSHPGQRSVGLVVAAVILFVLNPGQPGVVHQLMLPLGLAVAAWLMTRSLMAVLITATALCAINMEIGSTDWIDGFAYPAMALASFVGCLVIIGRRLQRKASATREERRAGRQQT